MSNEAQTADSISMQLTQIGAHVRKNGMVEVVYKDGSTKLQWPIDAREQIQSGMAQLAPVGRRAQTLAEIGAQSPRSISQPAAPPRSDPRRVAPRPPPPPAKPTQPAQPIGEAPSGPESIEEFARRNEGA
jgi:hypothetical protein